jgi:hypothetical protein
MFVCCVLSGRGLCDELIARLEESYRLWRVVVCDQENLVDEEAIARAGLQSQREKDVGYSVCFNSFQSNFSAFRLLPSSYLFWAGKRLVRHYDLPVPDTFPHVVRTLANR